MSKDDEKVDENTTLKLMCQLYKSKSDTLHEFIKVLIHRDWNYPENIHPIFSENLDDCWYYSKLSCIVYNVDKKVIGYIHQDSKIVTGFTV